MKKTRQAAYITTTNVFLCFVSYNLHFIIYYFVVIVCVQLIFSYGCTLNVVACLMVTQCTMVTICIFLYPLYTNLT